MVQSRVLISSNLKNDEEELQSSKENDNMLSSFPSSDTLINPSLQSILFIEILDPFKATLDPRRKTNRETSTSVTLN
jgi:hypothetical protein